MSSVSDKMHTENDPHWQMAEVMAWHGWGSPVGLSIMLTSIGLTAVLLRHALFG